MSSLYDTFESNIVNEKIDRMELKMVLSETFDKLINTVI